MGNHYAELNAKVKIITAKEVDQAESEKKKPELFVKYAAQGSQVYPDRFLFLVPTFSAIALYLILQAPSLLSVIIGAFLMYFYYDFYSGLVHVNLDDTRNLSGWKSIILFQGCLEFQWHHAIPQDITSKTFIECCADLNIIIAISAAVNCIVMGHTTGITAALTGLKLLFAYFGQHCHRSSHTSKTKRPAYVNALQNAGVMLDQVKHNGHHRMPHDENFCLIG
jgi:hypothetical protein